VPARALGELVKILPEPSPSADDPPIGLSLAAQRNHLVYYTAFCQFAVRLIEGNYPNYIRIIEQAQGGPTRATVATSELRKALQIAAHFAREDNHTVRLTLTPTGPQSPGQVLLQATSESGSTQSSVEALVEGPAAHIAFNTRFLLTTLGAIGTPTAVIEVHTAEAPGIVRPASPDAHVCVVMPMHIAKLEASAPPPTGAREPAPPVAQPPAEATVVGRDAAA
jgi:DNA polymerase III sliding clamp (beta) subunit (PCNA family)